MQIGQGIGRPPADERKKLARGLSIADDDPFRAVFMGKAAVLGPRKVESARP
jgi:hypothetical protein